MDAGQKAVCPRRPLPLAQKVIEDHFLGGGPTGGCGGNKGGGTGGRGMRKNGRQPGTGGEIVALTDGTKVRVLLTEDIGGAL